MFEPENDTFLRRVVEAGNKRSVPLPLPGCLIELPTWDRERTRIQSDVVFVAAPPRRVNTRQEYQTSRLKLATDLGFCQLLIELFGRLFVFLPSQLCPLLSLVDRGLGGHPDGLFGSAANFQFKPEADQRGSRPGSGE